MRLVNVWPSASPDRLGPLGGQRQPRSERAGSPKPDPSPGSAPYPTPRIMSEGRWESHKSTWVFGNSAFSARELPLAIKPALVSMKCGLAMRRQRLTAGVWKKRRSPPRGSR
jgi:hypothetical protein